MMNQIAAEWSVGIAGYRVLLDANDNFVDRFADYVLGQPDFDTNTSGTTQSKLNRPAGVD